MKKTLDEYVPIETIKIRQNYKTGISKETKTLMRERNVIRFYLHGGVPTMLRRHLRACK